VFSHAFAEESVLFRAARRVLLKGDPLTLHIESAQQVNELVTCLDASSGDASGHAALLERTFVVLHEEVRSEEDELLPRLQQLLSPRQLRALGRRWELVRRIAPTRPHPLVSRSPPGQALSALPLTVLDRGRDQLQWLDEATPGRWSGWLATATAPSLRLRARWGGSRCCSGGSAQRPGRRPAIRAYVTTRTLRNPRSSTGSGRTIPAEMLIGGTRG
jgi:hypothetical protein